jgi:PTH2 family peptidyl-tRNA hydrolase
MIDLPEAKQIIAVRTDLLGKVEDGKMDIGKVVAQASHASLGNVLEAMDKSEDLIWTLDLNKDKEMQSWLLGKFVKIAVAVKSEVKLLALHQKALDAGLRSTLIQDAGRTVFNNVPTYTCLAIGPHFAERVDPVTKKYPLLKYE